jgi:hypothetical protein
MKRPVIECSQCHREFTPIRVDQRFCSRSCLDRFYIDERRKAVAAYRQKQRMERATKFFSPVSGNPTGDDAHRAKWAQEDRQEAQQPRFLRRT